VSPPNYEDSTDDQVVADVAEALIAAAYLSQSRSLDTVISTIRTLNVPLAAIHQWSDAVLAAKRHIAKEPAEAKSETEGWLGALTKPSLKVFDYKFKNPEKGQLVLVSPFAVVELSL
jgi:dsRNA-specific ribonuclease